MKMKIFYSGEGGYKADPEYILQDKTNLMLTFANLRKTLTRRFRSLLKSRRKKKP